MADYRLVELGLKVKKRRTPITASGSSCSTSEARDGEGDHPALQPKGARTTLDVGEDNKLLGMLHVGRALAK
jgi:hypothetical protein